MAEFEPRLMQKKSFIRSKENVIASYNWTDIAEGTGLVGFNLCEEAEYTGGAEVKSYFLTTSNFISNSQTISIFSYGSNGTSNDYNFDVTFNNNNVLNGNAFIVLPVSLSGNGDSQSTYINVTLKKVSGATTTTISALKRTNTLTKVEAQPTQEKIFLMKMPISSAIFGQGDILRVTISIYFYINNGGGSTNLGIDPANRTFGNLETSSSTIYVPFKIEN